MINKTIYAEKKTLNEFKELAKEEGRTQGKMLEILVKEYKEKKGEK